MLVACITILLGTIYPIIIEVITNKRISVGAPYFNMTVLPILLPGFLLMSVAPALSWQSNKLAKFKSYLILFILMSILSSFITYFTHFNAWGFVGITLSLIIISASTLSIFYNYTKYNFNNFFLQNNAFIAHIGVGITILGVTCSSVFQTEHRRSLGIGETINIGVYSLELEDTKILEKNNYQELLASFVLYEKDKIVSKIKPSKRYYHVSKMITTEAGIYHQWAQDFYIVLGNQKDNKWDIKIYQNPLINFIWLGVIIMILSGLIGIRKK